MQAIQLTAEHTTDKAGAPIIDINGLPRLGAMLYPYQVRWLARQLNEIANDADQGAALHASVDVAGNRFEIPVQGWGEPLPPEPPVECPHRCGSVYAKDSYGAGFIEGSGMCPACDAAIPAKDIVSPGDEPSPPELLAAKLIDAWCSAHGQPIPWEKAVEITAIATSMSNEERERLLAMADEDVPVAQAGQVLDDVEAFLDEVRAELVRARSKFPGDRIMTIALAEEFGELCKAVLDEPAANVRKEAVQTAVMAARVVLDGDGSVTAWRAERGLDQLAAAPAQGGE